LCSEYSGEILGILRATMSSGTLSRVMTMRTMTRRLYSVQMMTVGQYSRILNSKQRENYQIVDVREPDELKAVNVNDQNILNLPISESWKWGGDIARHKTLDPEKPVICVVSVLILSCFSHILHSVVQEGEV
jgi:hypothetical protein